MNRFLKISFISIIILVLAIVGSILVLLVTANPVTPKMQQAINQVIQQPLPELIQGETGYAKNGDVSIWFESRKPSGPIKGHVLLMMGGAGSAIYWPAFFLNYMVDNGYHVIRYDYRGVGMSDRLENWDVDSAYDLTAMTKDAVSILDVLEIQKANVIGISMGGIIARQFALNHPERITTLVLISSVGLMHQTQRDLDLDLPVSDMLGLLLRYGFRDSERDQLYFMIGVLALMNGQSAEPLDVRTFSEMILYELRKRGGMNLVALRQHFHAIKQSGSQLDAIVNADLPVLVIHGARDPVIPIQSVKRFASQLKNGEHIWIEGAGHILAEGNSKPALKAIVDHMSQGR